MKIKHKFFGIFAILCLMLSLGVVVAATISNENLEAFEIPAERDKILKELTGIDFNDFSESSATLTAGGVLTVTTASGVKPVEFNINDLPDSITGVKYDESNNKVTLSYEGGAEFLASGGLLSDFDGETVQVSGIFDNKFKVDLSGGSADVSDNEVKLTGGATTEKQNPDGTTIKKGLTDDAEKNKDGKKTGFIRKLGMRLGELVGLEGDKEGEELSKGIVESETDSTGKEKEKGSVREGTVQKKELDKGVTLEEGKKYPNVVLLDIVDSDGKVVGKMAAYTSPNGKYERLGVVSGSIGEGGPDIGIPQGQLAAVTLTSGPTAPTPDITENGQPGGKPGVCLHCGGINQNGNIEEFTGNRRRGLLGKVLYGATHPFGGRFAGKKPIRTFVSRRPIVRWIKAGQPRRRARRRNFAEFVFKPRGLLRPRR